MKSKRVLLPLLMLAMVSLAWAQTNPPPASSVKSKELKARADAIICAHARVMAADPALRDATVRDIDGRRIVLPWFAKVQIDGARM